MGKSQFTINVKAGKVAAILVILSIVLVVLSLTGQSFRFFTLPFELRSSTQEFFLDLFIDKFSVNTESNIPTYFNTLILAIVSFLTFVIASLKQAQRDKYRNEWLFLAMVFLYMSIDEASVIHEQFSILLKGMPSMGGLFAYKWVVGGIAVVLILGVTFLRFFFHLDNRNKILFFISSAIYLTGALGSEIFSGRYQAAHGTKNFTYAVMTTLEEFLEWFGITLMIFTLLTYMENHFPEIRFLTKSKSSDAKE